MPLSVFAAVLLGAALHASWNAIVKSGPDKLLSTVLVAAGSALVAAAALPLLLFPAPAKLALPCDLRRRPGPLLRARRRRLPRHRHEPRLSADARPCPALVAVFGLALLGEHLSPVAWRGVALVSTGVFAMTFAAHGDGSRTGTLLALLNAGVIASYTLIDGVGVRASGAPVAYAMWLFLLNAVPLVAWALIARRQALLAYARRNFGLGLAGGLGNLGSYGLALWAMTAAPVARSRRCARPRSSSASRSPTWRSASASARRASPPRR